MSDAEATRIRAGKYEVRCGEKRCVATLAANCWQWILSDANWDVRLAPKFDSLTKVKRWVSTPTTPPKTTRERKLAAAHPLVGTNPDTVDWPPGYDRGRAVRMIGGIPHRYYPPHGGVHGLEGDWNWRGPDGHNSATRMTGYWAELEEKAEAQARAKAANVRQRLDVPPGRERLVEPPVRERLQVQSSRERLETGGRIARQRL